MKLPNVCGEPQTSREPNRDTAQKLSRTKHDFRRSFNALYITRRGILLEIFSATGVGLQGCAQLTGEAWLPGVTVSHAT